MEPIAAERQTCARQCGPKRNDRDYEYDDDKGALAAGSNNAGESGDSGCTLYRRPRILIDKPYESCVAPAAAEPMGLIPEPALRRRNGRGRRRRQASKTVAAEGQEARHGADRAKPTKADAKRLRMLAHKSNAKTPPIKLIAEDVQAKKAAQERRARKAGAAKPTPATKDAPRTDAGPPALRQGSVREWCSARSQTLAMNQIGCGLARRGAGACHNHR